MAGRSTTFCRKCHYALDHLRDDRCPECGTAFDRGDPATFFSIDEHTGNLLGRMRFFRALLLVSIVLAILLWTLMAIFDPVITPDPFEEGLLAFIAMCNLVVSLEAIVIFTLLTLLYLFRAAKTLGVSFAIGHVGLAVCLLPVLFLGVFVVPLMVEEEIMRRRAAEESRPVPIVSLPATSRLASH